MRIERLSLGFFGHFTDKVFDFGKARGESDFHLIYGANEAGKTTTMEAYLRLLYGFPLREPYAFQHQRQNLRVSGMLDLGGETRLFTRLPSRHGNLRGEGDTILPETAIAAHLGGLALDDYRSLLCLDDDTIEKGGEDIANARGDIGRLLFSAAAGVADLNAVLDQARNEAGSLYKKRASTTRVAELKRALAEVDAAIREKDVSAHAWRKLKEALLAARTEETTARTARDDILAAQAHVGALRRALPHLGEHDRLQREIVEHADYPARIDINPEELVTMLTERGQAEAELQRLNKTLDDTSAALAALVLDDERLGLAERLDGLDALRSRMQTAVLDLPRRQQARDEATADMMRIARDLGAPEGIEVHRLVISPAEIALLEDLRDLMRDTASARDAGAREIAQVETRLAESRQAWQALQDSPPARTGMMDLLAQFDADTLAPAAATAAQAIASADATLQETLQALSMGGRSFAALPDGPTDPSTAAELAQQHAALSDRHARADDRLAQLQEDIAAMAARIARLTDGAGVASDQQAQDAQAQRDSLWQAHRETLTADSADSFAPAMKAVDAINAARLARATEIGELRKLEQDLAEVTARAGRTQEQRDALAVQISETAARVESLAATIDLPALSPAAFADWSARHARAAAAARQRDALASQHKDTLARAERLRQALVPLVGLETPSFDAALRAARRLAAAERDHMDQVRAASDRTAALKTEQARRLQDQTALETAARNASADWHARVAHLFGTMLSPERLSAAPGQLRDLREHDARRVQAERQVTTMQQDQRAFAEAVTALAAPFGIDDSDPLDAFARLRDIADHAQADRKRHQDLSDSLKEGMTRRAELDARLKDIDRAVAELGAVFPRSVDTSSLEALRVAVGTARDVIAKRARIADLAGQILDELSLQDIDAARALIDSETAPALEARAATLKDDLALAEARLSAATTTRAHAERDLERVDAGAEIAELVERRTTLQMQIEEGVLDFLQRDFGLRLAEEAIRRYRDRHRSAMMAATERAFAQLTNGAYRRLLTQPDGASEILLAVDSGGTAKQIGDMSKGTRFQLYLALRAAAYEQMVAQGVQLPFFCDDVFETFDENRTQAACRLMERIGQSGQAIYLTHHRHVVEIARSVCDVPPVVHEL
ncbi:MAG: AAA family ATPase [Pararhodobacter sp.]|nr:AAA family ATPase [Pararhodobacter sp.]